MIASRLLDLLLVLTLLVFIGEGVRNGIARSLGAILGVIAGGALAFVAIPLLAAAVPDPFWRVAVIVAVSVALLFGGHALGGRIGRGIRDRRRDEIGIGSRLAGGAVNGVIGALTLALVAGGVSSLGVPLFSQAISGSYVVRVIDTVTPPPVDALLARVRSAVAEEGIPAIGEALGGVVDSPGVPDVPTDTDPLTAAAQSVVRIGGTAYACGQNQTGTGFVVAPDRIVTNAHVVAGVDQPVVEAPNGQTVEGRIVYLDTVDDLAIVAVDGLAVAPLALAPDLTVGADAVVEGYPYGGPFTRGAAEVLAVSTEAIPDIYGGPRTPREVYTLAAVVQPGNSGGPLLATDGRVAGVVFARGADDPELGYAMTNAELEPVASAASGFSASVSSGSCVRG
ncbi:MAG TPA: MarP family serine protease [Pseudolysinimonas sp.]|nr:MarP family serine protease [Pseudolysinimonas sp.]